MCGNYLFTCFLRIEFSFRSGKSNESDSVFHVTALQAVSVEAKDESLEADVSGFVSPSSLPALSLLSPKAMETAGRIIKVEEEHREEAKV